MNGFSEAEMERLIALQMGMLTSPEYGLTETEKCRLLFLIYYKLRKVPKNYGEMLEVKRIEAREMGRD